MGWIKDQKIDSLAVEARRAVDEGRMFFTPMLNTPMTQHKLSGSVSGWSGMLEVIEQRGRTLVSRTVAFALILTACVAASACTTSADETTSPSDAPAATATTVAAAHVSAPSNDYTQRKAVEIARDYLELPFSPFSRSRLIKQLEYEGFSNVDAVYAVDSLDVNWNEQAALTAESYLDGTFSLSRQDLFELLLLEGFTAEQAEYGVDSVGL